MYKSLFVMLTVIASALSPSLAAADNTIQLNPMVLIELGADMKADLVYSERMLTAEIKYNLASNNETSINNRDFLNVVTVNSVLALTNTSVFVSHTDHKRQAD